MCTNFRWLLLAATLLCVGCGGSDRPRGAAASGGESTERAVDFSGRLAAAQGINDLDMRDEALVEVAQAAAEEGAGAAVRQALEDISSLDQRNEIAAEVALKLAGAGQETEAVAIASMINDLDERNDVLARIAKGEGE